MEVTFRPRVIRFFQTMIAEAVSQTGDMQIT